VYSWLWRVLPGGLVGKSVLSLLLLAAAVAMLFFVVFPEIEPLVPFGDVTVDATPPPAEQAG
jgi:hypothetical protein